MHGFLLLLSLTGFAANACAQATSDASPAPEPLERSVRHTQAHADRVVLGPTAETHPAGTFFASTYDVVILQVGYAFSDRLHASIAGLVTGQLVELNVKANVLRSEHLRVAVLSAIDYARAESEDDDESLDLVFGRVGGTLQVCFELRCRSSLNLAATVVLHDQSNIILPLGLSTGLTAFVSDEVSLLLEYSGLMNAARDLELVDLPVHVLAYGVRFSGNQHWSLDATLLRPLASDDEIRVASPSLFDFFGLPLLAFTYRFGM